MREEFEKLAVAGKIEGRHVEPLVQLATTGFCVHRSWGFGRIRSLDTVFARFVIDFPGRPGHLMDLAFACEVLKPIPPDHILARKALDPDGLRQMAVAQPVELVKIVLLSYGGKATLEQIQQALVPEVIPSDWKKWWETVRHALKKDGHFHVPLKKSEPIQYQAEEVGLQDRLLGEFRAAKGLKAKLAVVGELLRNSQDLADPQAAAAEVIASLTTDIASHARTQPALALEAVFARDDLGGMVGAPPAEGEWTAQAIWRQLPHLGPILEALPTTKHHRALEEFRAAFPDQWDKLLLEALNNVPARICRELAGKLIEHGRLDALKDTLARLINHHTASSELLLWLGRERSDAFADLLGPEVFRAMLSAMERDQFNEKRSNRLREFILDDQALIGDLTASADLDVIKDLTRALQFSPVFDDMDKRSLLARVVKSHPSIQALITGEQTRQDTTFWVSWESLERRRAEYDELVHVKIPANSREIALARSFGDLSENHEYKAAKEMQKLLLQRKEELEGQLMRARGTDFANLPAETVGVGTVVRATDLTTHQAETFTILGAWDSKPEEGVISYLSPVARALLGHKPGDEVEFELGGTVRRHRIESVQPYRPAAPAPSEPVPPSAATSPPASPPPPATAPSVEVTPQLDSALQREPSLAPAIESSVLASGVPSTPPSQSAQQAS